MLLSPTSHCSSTIPLRIWDKTWFRSRPLHLWVVCCWACYVTSFDVSSSLKWDNNCSVRESKWRDQVYEFMSVCPMVYLIRGSCYYCYYNHLSQLLYAISSNTFKGQRTAQNNPSQCLFVGCLPLGSVLVLELQQWTKRKSYPMHLDSSLGDRQRTDKMICNIWWWVLERKIKQCKEVESDGGLGMLLFNIRRSLKASWIRWHLRKDLRKVRYCLVNNCYNKLA
jgi:hypothetical protein